MPANTWTPSALASEAQPWRGSGWRAVEAQHRVATMVLSHGNLADQATLEDILDSAKPPMPSAVQGLHWLLATPFRHWPARSGSRFRRRQDPGVFYGALERRTAAAEAGYWRLRFWLDSAGLRDRPAAVELTLFEFHAATARAIDLRAAPLQDAAADWTQPNDYSATQTLASAARAAGVELIRYRSVRDFEGCCLAVLAPAMFKAVEAPYQHVQQSWSLTIAPPDTVVWQRHLEDERWQFRFPAAQFPVAQLPVAQFPVGGG